MAKKKKKRVVTKPGTQNSETSNKGHGDSNAESTPKLASFETSLNELEKIVAELESGQLSLAESLSKYESGIRNLKTCHQILESAENRIRLLTGVDKDGTPQTTDFDSQKTELHQRSDKRSMESALDGSIDLIDDPEEVEDPTPEEAVDEFEDDEFDDDEFDDDEGRLF